MTNIRREGTFSGQQETGLGTEFWIEGGGGGGGGREGRGRTWLAPEWNSMARIPYGK